jgi:phosphate transport system substrate-binding protein
MNISVFSCLKLRLAVCYCSAMLAANSAFATDITGAGSTFFHPIMSKWSNSYYARTGIKINYQATGSGDGIAQVKSGAVTFAASDKPLPPEALKAAGLVQFPIVISGVVPIVNIENVKEGEMRFTGTVLADIYLGKIKKWNDPAIVSLNPAIGLRDEKITVVHRSDSSGTTFNWGNYLAKSSDAWKTQKSLGIYYTPSLSVNWPTGVGVKGNEGVAAYVSQIKGAIGYIALDYAIQKKLSYAEVQNKAGNFVKPSFETFQAAAAGVDWNTLGFYKDIINSPGKDAWPIMASVFVIIHKQPKDATASAGALRFFKWAINEGRSDARELNYVSPPTDLVKQIDALLDQGNHVNPLR